MKQRFRNILFWSVISAAFIGPGTVTTAASSGAGFGYSLIWTLFFSAIACYVLQEASARITATTGMNLGEAMQQEYGKTRSGKWIIWLALIAILSGCIAFETGNILGAVAGVTLIHDSISVPLVVASIGIISAALLWKGTVKQIATTLGLIVAIMGFCFIITALLIPHDLYSILGSGLVPDIPAGAEFLVLGLIGTTVVPYNIFLGSGLKHAQTPREMKISLGIAIFLGAFISIAILLTGTAITGDFTFEALANALADQLGGWAPWLLGIGLFGAGLSSTLTAALAASITAKSLLVQPDTKDFWGEHSLRFRLVWGTVLIIGLIFGMLQVQPVPAIILAQALNGIILPIVAIVLFILLNNDNVLPAKHQNGKVYNTLTAVVVYLTFLIGLTNINRALSRITEIELLSQNGVFLLSVVLFAIIMIPLSKKLLTTR